MKPVVISVARLPDFLKERLHECFDFYPELEKEDPEKFAQLALKARAVVASGTTTLTREMMARFPKLEIIPVFGVGYDGIDLKAARERGIKVTNTPDVLTDDVADLALGLMLNISRQLVQADGFVRSGNWRKGGSFPLSRKLSKSRLGVFGLGRIGQAIAKRAEGFDMAIAYSGRRQIPSVSYQYYPDLKTLAGNVDFLVIAASANASTKALVNKEVLDALGPQGYLINIARGSVVNEPDLVAALVEKRIAGAGLDVFVDEPNVPEALLSLPNVVLTPHIASATRQTRLEMARLVTENLVAHFDGKALLTPVPD